MIARRLFSVRALCPTRPLIGPIARDLNTQIPSILLAFLECFHRCGIHIIRKNGFFRCAVHGRLLGAWDGRRLRGVASRRPATATSQARAVLWRDDGPPTPSLALNMQPIVEIRGNPAGIRSCGLCLPCVSIPVCAPSRAPIPALAGSTRVQLRSSLLNLVKRKQKMIFPSASTIP